jgi:hypothetical protein
MNRRLGVMVGLLAILLCVGSTYLIRSSRQIMHRAVSDEQRLLNSTAAQMNAQTASAPAKKPAEEPTVVAAGF